MLLSLLILVLLVAPFAGLAIWAWVRGRGKLDPALGGPAARRTLEKLRQIAGSASSDANEHAGQVAEIASALRLADANSDDSVLTAVARLVEVNQRMQQQLLAAEEKLHAQTRQIQSHAAEARTDALTQVANRRALDDELARRVDDLQRRGEVTTVMLLDVDHFKTFNDAYGHQAGDAVLRSVAQVLRHQVRETDVVARYGGEEFAIIYSGSLPVTRPAAERARAAIAGAMTRIEGRELRVAASGGLAELQPGEDQQELLKRADLALYASKKAGRNCLHWNDGYHNHLVELEQRPTIVKSAARDDLSSLLEPDWNSGEENLPETISEATEVYVSSKTTFVDDLIRRLAQCKRGQAPLCLMLVQLDHFGEAIKNQGPEAAGLALRVAAQLLQANMRDMDHVSRLGGDTFALLLPSARLEDGARCAERIRRAAAHCRLPIKAKGLRLSLTIGIVETMAGDDMRRLLQRGRNALQVAIDRGRSCVYAQDVSGKLGRTPLAALG